MDGPIYKDQLISDESFQDELDYLVSRLRAALSALHEFNDGSDKYLTYLSCWEDCFAIELTRCLLHIGVGEAMHRPLHVPTLLAILVDRNTPFHGVNYIPDRDDDPSQIVPNYRKAWWTEKEPSPIPLIELQGIWATECEFHLSQLKGKRAPRELKLGHSDGISMADLMKMKDTAVEALRITNTRIDETVYDLKVLQNAIDAFGAMMLVEEKN